MLLVTHVTCVTCVTHMSCVTHSSHRHTQSIWNWGRETWPEIKIYGPPGGRPCTVWFLQSVLPGGLAQLTSRPRPIRSPVEDEHRHAVHALISCSWIHNMLIPESITGISCFMFRPKPSQRLPTLHGRALHGFHFHHHVSPGLIPCNYGKNHAVHGTCHGSAWSLCQTQKKVKSWHVIKSFSL